MASGHVYKEGKNWYTSIRHNGQRKRKMIGTNKEIAQKILQAELGKLALSDHGLLEDSKTTLSQFAEEFLNYKKTTMRPKSYDRVKGIIDKHLKVWLGRYMLFDLTPERVSGYRTNRLHAVTPSTVNREVAVLHNMLTVAVEWHRIKVNPIDGVLRKLKEPPGRVRFLTREQAQKLLDACNALKGKAPHLRNIVLMALMTGMRKGEILTLKWDYVKLENRVMLLPQTKNNTVRVVPINNTLYAALEAMPSREGYVFGNGKPLLDVKKSFRSACKAAGITDFRYHDLRHTYASHATMKGIPSIMLQALLGHKTPAMTSRYSHLAPQALQAAQKLLDEVLALPAPAGQ